MFYFLHSPLLPSLRAKRSNPLLPSPSLRAKRGNPAPLSSRHCERSVAIQPPSPPVIANEVKQSNTPSIKFGGPFYPSDHSGHQIWGSVLPFRPPRASNLGVRFTLPTTPSIEFGGHSCIIDLSDTLIWGSFFYHRPARHSNLGVKLPVPRRLHTPLLSKPTNQSESPHLFFATPRGYHRESSRKRSEGREGDAKGNGNFAPLPRFLFTFKLHFLL